MNVRRSIPASCARFFSYLAFALLLVPAAFGDSASAQVILTATPSSVAPGGSVTAGWAGVINPAARDWIGLYAVGAGDGSYQNWLYVSCTRTPVSGSAAGACSLAVPAALPNGNYELRLFANDGYNRLATSSIFAVGVSAPPLTVSTNALPNGTVGLGYNQVLAATGGSNTGYIWTLTNGTSPPAGLTLDQSGSIWGTPTLNTSVTFSIQVRDSLGATATQSLTLTINSAPPPGPALLASPVSLSQGESVAATWSGIGNPAAKDWLGLYAIGAADGSFQNWVYVSCSRTAGAARPAGNCPLMAPTTLANGNYEVRLFANDGFGRLATSNSFAVSSLLPSTVSITGGNFVFNGSPRGAPAFAYGVGGVNDVLSPAVTITYQGTGGTTYGPTSAAPTNTGTYTATAAFAGNANYQSASNSATVTITPAAATLTLTNLSQAYDGNPKTAAVTTNPVGLSGVTLSYNGSSTAPTNVGNYTVLAILTNANFAAPNATNTLVISTAISTTTVVVADATYDGLPHGGSASATGIGGLNQALAVTYTGVGSTVYPASTTAPTNAGAYNASASFPGDATHSGSSDAKNFSIIQATAGLSLSNLSQTYDGNPKPVTVTTIPAGLTGVTVTYNGSSTVPANVGSYTVVATLTHANYSAPNATTTLVINKAASTTTVTVADATYDGLPHGGSASATGIGGLNQVLSVTYAGVGTTVYPASATAPTNAGVYSASANFSGDATHNGSSDSKNFSINQAVAGLSLNSLTYIYDGNAKTATATTTPTGLSVVTITYNGSTTPPVSAGSYTVIASLANVNYAAANASSTLIITKSTVALNVSGAKVPFDGSPHGATGFAYGVGGVGDVQAPALTFSYQGAGSTVYGPTSTAPTNAGSYTAVATFAGNNNYNSASTSVSITIDVPAGPALTANTANAMPGSFVTINWSGIANPTARDWIGLFVPGAANTNYLSWVYTSCSQAPSGFLSSGSCAFGLPNTKGTFEFRMFANDGFNRLATSSTFGVGMSAPALTVVTSTLPNGTAGTNYNQKLAATGGSNTGYVWALLAGSVLPAGLQLGPDGSITGTPNLNTTVTFSVQVRDSVGAFATQTLTLTIDPAPPPGPVLTASPSSVSQGGTLTASWSGIANPAARDWIGLYALGAGDGGFRTWVYVSCSQTPGSAKSAGSCSIGVPGSLSDGTYELRLYANDGYARLATSKSITVPAAVSSLRITSPSRNVTAAPNVATLSVNRQECGAVMAIPYIQASSTLTVAASVPGDTTSGVGVKFVLNENLPGQVVAYTLTAPYTATFNSLPKGEYRLDAYLVDGSQNIIAGASNHDFATNIAIGDVFVAIGDSITEGYVGAGYNVPPYPDWLQAPVKSISNRNYPQCGIGTGFYRDHWQEESHHIDLADELETYLGYPVFILNEGVAGITTYGYLDRIISTVWQDRINSLRPNKWLIHLGNNDVGGSVEVQNNFQILIDAFKNSYGAAPSNIFLAIPTNGINWNPYINNLISGNGLSRGPDFNTFYLNNTNPVLLDGIHPNLAGHEQMARLWALSLISPRNVRTQLAGAQVIISWDDLKTIEPSVAGYKLYYGTDINNLSNVFDVGAATTALLTPPGTQKYFFAVQAYDNDAFAPNFSARSLPVASQP